MFDLLQPQLWNLGNDFKKITSLSENSSGKECVTADERYLKLMWRNDDPVWLWDMYFC